MKKLFYLVLFLTFNIVYSQDNDKRISDLRYKLELLSIENTGLTENYKTKIQVSSITLPNLLKAVSEIHKININVSSDLNNLMVINNFPEVTVFDLLLFLCKEYNLTMEFTGSIIAIKPFSIPEKPIEKRIIPVTYNQNNNTITIDAKEDKVYDLFKRIIDVSGKNLVFAPGLENTPLTSYIKDVEFDVAMYKLALANNLYTEKTKDGFWRFENHLTQDSAEKKGTFKDRSIDNSYKILNYEEKLLEVDFNKKPIANVIHEISSDLNIDIFTATPLEKAGIVTLKSKEISFDELLVKMFESQNITGTNQSNTNSNRNSNPVESKSNPLFNFKKEGDLYFFGTEDQLSIRTVEVIHLQYRSVELLADPSNSNGANNISSKVLNNLNGINDDYGQNFNGNTSRNNNSNNRNTQSNNSLSTRAGHGINNNESLLSVIPEELTKDLDIKVDYELNSFYVTGVASSVERFKKFISKLDKRVPNILIEVWIIEAKKTADIETGVSWGIGNEPSTTKGALFPETDATLGAATVNKLLGSFNNFAGFNLGKVGPNFFATIKAMESNGDLKIRSTPKLSTLNSHRATFSNGQTSFYAVTRRNIYGSDNPQTSEITNYLPIDAELGLTIKPSVSGDGQVILDISVVQSSFGSRIADDAPPDVISRNFSSIIRMQDQDIAILGGLEEQMKSNSGSGVPFLAKIPLIKYLFSKRKRSTSKSKLTILIKPIVTY
ncbi:hypothetical protein [Pontimicrobium sp. SW4]|uniref:Type II/III secretion system secretin-like domain-containing protein n=1 Tax=Pontimicrobium sp. SW4 TaxID=3153519 RepID=A0AAU7BQ43_9FLAO